MNVKMLRQIQFDLLDPKNDKFVLDMNRWVGQCKVGKKDCGTAVCIGGDALLLAGYKPVLIERTGMFFLRKGKTLRDLQKERKEVGEVDSSVSSVALDEKKTAAKILKLEDKEMADRLFFVDSWPDIYKEAYNETSNNLRRRHIAADRIGHFIQTGGLE